MLLRVCVLLKLCLDAKVQSSGGSSIVEVRA
jgi:hypothetical protein